MLYDSRIATEVSGDYNPFFAELMHKDGESKKEGLSWLNHINND